jgi:hypothetical protein
VDELGTDGGQTTPICNSASASHGLFSGPTLFEGRKKRPLTNWELRYATRNPIHAALIHRRKRTVARLRRSALADSTAVEVVMPTFKIELAQTVIERATVWIEADSEGEAAKLALTEDAEWRFAEAYGDIEVIGVEESKWHRREIRMRRRRRIGLASPFSKSRRPTLPPPASKH